MRQKFLLISIFLFMTLTGQAHSQEEASSSRLVLTFEAALKIALERNINIILAEERVNQAMTRITQNRAHLYPQLTAGALQNRQTKDLSTTGISTTAGVVGPFDVFDARLKLTQSIFDPGTLERLKSAQASTQLTQAQREETRQDILALVALLFIDAKRSTQSVDLFKTLVSRDEKNLTIAVKHFEIGSRSDLQVKEAQAALAQSQARLQMTKTEALERRLDLLAALGYPVDKDMTLEWNSDPQMFSNSFQIEMDETMERHPKIAVAHETLQVSKADEDIEKAGYLPKISLISDYGLSADLPQDSSTTYSYGVQATFPIFEGGSRPAQIDEAKSKVRANEARFEDTKRQVTAGILNNREKVKQAEAFYVERLAELSVAEKKWELAQRRRTNGIGSEQELEEAKANMALSQDQKEEAVATLLMARISLAHVQGSIDKVLLPSN